MSKLFERKHSKPVEANYEDYTGYKGDGLLYRVNNTYYDTYIEGSVAVPYKSITEMRWILADGVVFLYRKRTGEYKQAAYRIRPNYGHLYMGGRVPIDNAGVYIYKVFVDESYNNKHILFKDKDNHNVDVNNLQPIDKKNPKPKSFSEDYIKHLLEKNGVSYKAEYTFDNLRGVGGGRLRYDFAILDDEGKVLKLIEHDNFEHQVQPDHKFYSRKRVEHDRRKNQYAIDNGIPLVRITKFYRDIRIEELVA